MNESIGVLLGKLKQHFYYLIFKVLCRSFEPIRLVVKAAATAVILQEVVVEVVMVV